MGGKYAVYFLEKKNYKLSGNITYDRFDYTESVVKDQNRLSEKIIGDKYYLNEDLKLQIGYKREDLSQYSAGRKKTKNEYGFLVRYKIDNPFINSIKLDTETGYRDAREDEGNDEDLDYKFRNLKTRFDHSIGKTIKLHNDADYYYKDYLGTGQYSNEGFELTQGWKLTPLKMENNKLGIDFIVSYKKFNYLDRNDLDFEKTSTSFKCTFAHHACYKLIGGMGFNHRNQRDNTKDRNDYTYLVGYEREIIANRLTFALNGEHTTRDYKNSGDKKLYRFKLEMSYRI